MQRLGALEDDLNRIVDAQQIVRTAISSKRTCTMHVLGHDIAVAVFFARIVDRKNVRMLQHADQVRFGEEHLARNTRPLLIPTGLTVVDLNRNITPIISIMGQIHRPGASAAHLLDDHVLADLLGNLTGWGRLGRC